MVTKRFAGADAPELFLALNDTPMLVVVSIAESGLGAIRWWKADYSATRADPSDGAAEAKASVGEAGSGRVRRRADGSGAGAGGGTKRGAGTSAAARAGRDMDDHAPRENHLHGALEDGLQEEGEGEDEDGALVFGVEGRDIDDGAGAAQDDDE
jgi:hypothetical protein